MSKLSLNLVKNDNQASRILDLMRFLSALIVVLFHFYVPLPGYQAVMVFFVLSGYFISSTVLKTVSENRWNWSDYLLKRITRLWIVLLPCLLLTFIWAKVQMNLFEETKIFSYLDWKVFLGNLFFLQGIVVPVYGANGPLWSLSYEFWYYILFPCLVLIFLSRKKSAKVLYALMFIVISLCVGQKIMEYFLVWLLGALIPLVKPFKLKKQFFNYLIFLFSAVLALISMKTYVLFEDYPAFQIIPDLSIGITFSFLVYVIISLFNNRPSRRNFNLSKQLAGFSYTLYLTHYPLANFIFAWLASPLWPFAEGGIFIKIMIAIFVIVYGWIIASLTENHTDKVRKSISKLIFRDKTKKAETPYAVTKIQ
ncbi:acyltransferase family protein [Domibacillus mangrovi]|uniref:Acyltransferase 3 domain-containing protein n=1 Tax=Domibacillus mangrovi TaxID=1714354 RepID=A0A1Q5P2Z7_9BACI|nr:acyltransferase [Domibacillus mangrovi]OKL36568.1 hypothetical protein BLL40_07460 [Domibacillus mangrovi]